MLELVVAPELRVRLAAVVVTAVWAATRPLGRPFDCRPTVEAAVAEGQPRVDKLVAVAVAVQQVLARSEQRRAVFRVVLLSMGRLLPVCSLPVIAKAVVVAS